MKLSTIIKRLEEIAPTRLAEEWDNVGLIAGDPAQEISKILLTIDYSREVAAEAKAEKCDLIVAYHPPIFDGVKKLAAGDLVFDAIRRNVAIYSPHTALDVAEGGTNDLLADAVGMVDRRPLRISPGKQSQFKLVVFVPAHAVEKLSAAIFDAGAGKIGNYSSCGFQSVGTGTFFGQPGSAPTVGQAGRLEKAEEIRLETIVPAERVDDVIRALKANHPYEEPAFDLNMLAVPPEGQGQGRIGAVASIECAQMLEKVKQELGLRHLLVAGPTDGIVKSVAVCAGSGGKFLDDAIDAAADLFLTGELRHHDALKAVAAGMIGVCTLHSNCERGVLKRLAAKLAELKGMPPTIISAVDRDPFVIH